VFHVGLEHYLRTHDLELACEKMEERYHEHPFIDTMILHSTKRMLPLYPLPQEKIETEVQFEYPLILPSGRSITIRGKLDGIQGSTLVEHKCKKFVDPLQTKDEIPWDLQVNLYAYVKELDSVQYDLILIPDEQFTKPHKLKDESTEKYCTRIYLHHSSNLFPIKSKSRLWIHQIQLDLDPERVEQVFRETFIPLAERMCDWYDHVTSPNFNINDPTTWNSNMYRSPIRHFDPGRTDGYKGNYWNFLTGNIEEQDLCPVNLFSELKE